MAPVVRALARTGTLTPVLLSTGQHRELLESALVEVDLVPDVRLDLMSPGQSPVEVLSRILHALPPVLTSLAPAAVLVQGDTSTVLGATLAAWHMGIPVGHVEAGLRTHDLENPFPEEGNRQLVDRLARWLFAPTPLAAANLVTEGLAPRWIHVTGNTAVDEILRAAGQSSTPLPPGTVLITLHRRESFGEPLEHILAGLVDFLRTTPDAKVLWPVHPNPRVQEAARSLDPAVAQRIKLCEPMGYRAFAGCLRNARLVLTDSGGVQEEAPTFGVRVLVARDVTERPEGVEAGVNRLVGRSRPGVARALLEAWQEPAWSGPIPAPNPYGDGRAGERIAEILERELCGGEGGGA